LMQSKKNYLPQRTSASSVKSRGDTELAYAPFGGIVKIVMIVFIMVLFIAVTGDAGELLVPDDSKQAVQQADTAGRPQNTESTGPAEREQSVSQGEQIGTKTDSPVAAYKLNYFAINNSPGNDNAQVKFQISMKFRVLRPNLYVLKYNVFPAYFAYTQMSLWNVGQPSRPFEESNYNPEFFLDYQINAGIIGRIKLRNIVVSPLEHESNGLAGIQSRSWNRQYILIKFGVESKEELAEKNSFLSDKALLYVKLWHASGYGDERAYLQSIGSSDTFLNYMGHGEIGVSIRNFLWGGSLRDHQLDIKTPIFRTINKDSYKLEFRQQLPNMNFAIFLQYWYGYGETLLRFDQFERRSFVGLSFSY
jgi:phospholipase A1